MEKFYCEYIEDYINKIEFEKWLLFIILLTKN